MQDVDLLQSSLSGLKMAQTKFNSCKETLNSMVPSNCGKEILVPLNSSVSKFFSASIHRRNNVYLLFRFMSRASSQTRIPFSSTSGRDITPTWYALSTILTILLHSSLLLSHRHLSLDVKMTNINNWSGFYRSFNQHPLSRQWIRQKVTTRERSSTLKSRWPKYREPIRRSSGSRRVSSRTDKNQITISLFHIYW